MRLGGADPCAVRTTGSNSSNRATKTWHRIKAKISRLLRNAFANTRTVQEWTRHLPCELVEMIITHLTDDLHALKACSLTCRSWYTIALAYVHHTLVLRGSACGSFRSGLDSLSNLHKLGMIPLVKEIRVVLSEDTDVSFGPEVFAPSDLLHFSAFTNVHTLRIRALDVDRFIPVIGAYFQQFSSTLRSISLYHPTFSAPQYLSCFLSLFPNLDDVEIRWPSPFSTTIPGTEFMPFSAPEFRGRLVLEVFPVIETWTHLISMGGVLRFNHMELREVEGSPILLEACAETLETLRIYMSDNLC